MKQTEREVGGNKEAGIDMTESKHTLHVLISNVVWIRSVTVFVAHVYTIESKKVQQSHY